MNDCECGTWACDDMRAMMLGNGHNPNCQHFKAGEGALALIGQLVEGIREWAAQEDGVPEELWDAYAKGVFLTTGKMLNPVDV